MRQPARPSSQARLAGSFLGARVKKKKKFDYLSLYQKYPKKFGKRAGLARLAVRVKTDEQYADFVRALDNYIKYLEREQMEPQFIKYFVTFVNNYEDWLDDDAGSVILRKRTMEDVLGED